MTGPADIADMTHPEFNRQHRAGDHDDGHPASVTVDTGLDPEARADELEDALDLALAERDQLADTVAAQEAELATTRTAAGFVANWNELERRISDLPTQVINLLRGEVAPKATTQEEVGEALAAITPTTVIRKVHVHPAPGKTHGRVARSWFGVTETGEKR